MFLLPDSCCLCGRTGRSPCVPCLSALPAPPRLPAPPGLTSLFALVAYEGEGRRLVQAVKYRNRRGPLLWIAAGLAGAAGSTTYDCVTWVPCSPAGRRHRGFDPGRLLARRVARHLRVPCRRLLLRSAGRSQTDAGRVERLAGPPLRAAPGVRPAGSILVIDDVCTTGASLSTAAAILRAGGATIVNGAVAARTPLARQTGGR